MYYIDMMHYIYYIYLIKLLNMYFLYYMELIISSYYIYLLLSDLRKLMNKKISDLMVEFNFKKFIMEIQGKGIRVCFFIKLLYISYLSIILS